MKSLDWNKPIETRCGSEVKVYEIFNNRELSQDVTTVIFDLLEAVKLEA